MKFLCAGAGYTLPDQKRSTDIHSEPKIFNLTERIERQRENWYKHILQGIFKVFLHFLFYNSILLMITKTKYIIFLRNHPVFNIFSPASYQLFNAITIESLWLRM
jgi:hypothetical protein